MECQKPLTFLHKEKNRTCQLVKAVTKEDVGRVTRTSQKIQFAKKTKAVPKNKQDHKMSLSKTFGNVNPTKPSVCGCDSQRVIFGWEMAS